MIAFDTNLLVRALVADHPEHNVASRFFGRIGAGRQLPNAGLPDLDNQGSLPVRIVCIGKD